MNVLPEKELCLRCKGRGYCNLDFCPAYAKLESLSRISNSLNKEQFSSSVPGVFVGKFGYPTINVGLLAMPEISRDAWLYDSPSYWGNHGFDISKVIEMRSSLINSRIPLAVRDKNHLLDSMQEVAMSSRPVDVEILLSKKPFFKVSFEPYVAPIGANAALKEFTLTENPCIPVAVDKAVSDTDLKAADAIMSLSKKHFDETALTRLLSIGNLGVKFERKLVPTRWSITAVDDIIGKDLIDFVKQASDRMPYSAFFGGYLGNYFLILCFPEPWSYELFETYAGGMGRTGVLGSGFWGNDRNAIAILPD